MLILKRKVDEAIKINRNITIRILEINENQVKIGIDAPREIEILRSELIENVKENVKIASEAISNKPENLNNLHINKIKKLK